MPLILGISFDEEEITCRGPALVEEHEYSNVLAKYGHGYASS